MDKDLLISLLQKDPCLSSGESVTEQIKRIHPADLADAVSEVAAAPVIPLLLQLDRSLLVAIFTHLSDEKQDEFIQHLPRDVVVAVFERMPSDDRADLYNRMGEDSRQKLLPALAQAEQEDVLRMASYPGGSTGSETTSAFVAVPPKMNVREALIHIRETASDKETIYVIYVLDADTRLLGTVSLRELVLAHEEQLIEHIMRSEPISAHARWPRDRAAELIHHYELLALPVIDDYGKMIGIVTMDDAMDIERKQDTTQLARFGGTAVGGSDDLDILLTPLKHMFRVRVFWLGLLTVFGIVTSTYVAAQEELLSSFVILAAFLAPVIDMGGNTGSQSATLVIRAMALGEVKMKWQFVWLVIRRELPVCVALGIVIALLEVLLAWFSKGVGVDVMMVVGLSMLVCTVLGGVIGAMLPFVARGIGTDPATLSSPLITSIMDLLGVFIYFGFAWVFLGPLLNQ